MYDLDLTGFKGEDDLLRPKPVPGKHLVEVTAVKAGDPERTPCEILDLVVIKSTVPGLVGYKFSEWLYLTDSSKKRVALFASKLGLIKTWGARCTIDWSQAVGRKIVVEVAERTFKNQEGEQETRVGITFDGVYRTDDPRVQSWFANDNSPSKNYENF
jgi:hypothetical protein